MRNKMVTLGVAAVAAMGLAATASANVIVAGNLVADLQSGTLSSASSTWVNQATGADSVGNFTTNGASHLNVVSVAYGSGTYNALGVVGNSANAVISANTAPSAIAANGAVSVEEWLSVTSVSNYAAGLVYGLQGNHNQSREFNYGTAKPLAGQFNDATWHGYTPPAGTHYVAWVYEPGVATGTSPDTVLVYVDGSLVDTSGFGNSGTVATDLAIGTGNNATTTSSTITWGRDTFNGDILAARVETGVLTASDVANNYTAGPGGVVAVPDAAPLALLAVGGLGLLLLKRRRTA